ncbi:Aldehyde dehydrogenase [Mycena sanguinolenta]|uniref:Aldehyde dehydrogenase n=1 Tax=Mycena sanguinolenta TaxID=230812 RepID=A0A8H6Y293_9AGAR|nr:Aldehyde dehydrogenase [Mycena sanguinolenta]
MKRGFLNGAKAKRESQLRDESDSMVHTTIGDDEQVSECFFHHGTKEAFMKIPNFPEPLQVTTPAFRMVDIPGKGAGLVSIRELKMGDLILNERPLFVAAEELCLAIPPKGEKYFEASLDRMRPEAKTAFMALCNCHKAEENAGGALVGLGPLLGIVNTNGVSLSLPAAADPWPQGGQTRPYSAVCENISRLNHSCSPNTVPQFHAASFSWRLYAARDITAGEELTRQYVSIQHPAAERQAALKQIYDFVCACPACTDPSISDPRRATIAAFAATHHGKQESSVVGFSSLDNDRFAECRTQAELIESEGLQHLPVYSTVLKLLIEASVVRMELSSACQLARKLDKCRWVDDRDAYQDHPLWRALVG